MKFRTMLENTYSSNLLLEALNDSQKAMVDQWPKHDGSNNDHIFGDKDRLTFPLDAGEHQHPNVPDPDVNAHLEKHGFKVKDYRAGIATSPDGRDMRIGRVLNRTKAHPDLIKTFNEDATRNTTKAGKSGLSVTYSRHPHDVAAMSTGQGWNSCMNMEGGCNSHYLKDDVKEGTVVAYLHKSDDHDLQHPLARMALKPHINDNVGEGYSETALLPEDVHYGTNNGAFSNHVISFAHQHSKLDPTKLYGMHPDLYNDTNTRGYSSHISGQHVMDSLKAKKDPHTSHNSVLDPGDIPSVLKRSRGITSSHMSKIVDHLTSDMSGSPYEHREALSLLNSAARNPSFGADHADKVVTHPNFTTLKNPLSKAFLTHDAPIGDRGVEHLLSTTRDNEEEHKGVIDSLTFKRSTTESQQHRLLDAVGQYKGTNPSLGAGNIASHTKFKSVQQRLFDEHKESANTDTLRALSKNKNLHRDVVDNIVHHVGSLDGDTKYIVTQNMMSHPKFTNKHIRHLDSLLSATSHSNWDDTESHIGLMSHPRYHEAMGPKGADTISQFVSSNRAYIRRYVAKQLFNNPHFKEHHITNMLSGGMLNGKYNGSADILSHSPAFNNKHVDMIFDNGSHADIVNFASMGKLSDHATSRALAHAKGLSKSQHDTMIQNMSLNENMSESQAHAVMDHATQHMSDNRDVNHVHKAFMQLSPHKSVQVRALKKFASDPEVHTPSLMQTILNSSHATNLHPDVRDAAQQLIK